MFLRKINILNVCVCEHTPFSTHLVLCLPASKEHEILLLQVDESEAPGWIDRRVVKGAGCLLVDQMAASSVFLRLYSLLTVRRAHSPANLL